MGHILALAEISLFEERTTSTVDGRNPAPL